MKKVTAKVKIRFKGLEEKKTFEVGEIWIGSLQRFKALNERSYVQLIKIETINNN